MLLGDVSDKRLLKLTCDRLVFGVTAGNVCVTAVVLLGSPPQIYNQECNKENELSLDTN